jgi:hypothetical protein
MIHLLSPEQTQWISGGNIAIDLDDSNFIIVPSTGIPKPCARALEYSFNGLMNQELTTAEVISVSLVYGKCTLNDFQLFIKNIEATLGNH